MGEVGGEVMGNSELIFRGGALRSGRGPRRGPGPTLSVVLDRPPGRGGVSGASAPQGLPDAGHVNPPLPEKHAEDPVVEEAFQRVGARTTSVAATSSRAKTRSMWRDDACLLDMLIAARKVRAFTVLRC